MAVTYEGHTKAQVTRGLSGNAEDKCKCLRKIADLGQSASNCLGYGDDVIRCLHDPSRDVKCAALNALASMGPAGASDIDLVASHLWDDDVEVRCSALSALGGIGIYARKYEQAVADLVLNQNPAVRAAAARALGRMKAMRQTVMLRRCLLDSEPKVVAAAVDGAGLLGEAGSVMAEDISALLEHQDTDVRLAAVIALTKFGESAHRRASQVVALLADDSNVVRQAAVSYFAEVPLGFLAYKEVCNIEKLLIDEDGRAQAAAAVALGHIQGNHGILMERLKRQDGDLASKARPLPIDTKKLIALLDSEFEDDEVVLLAAAGVERKPPVELRRPSCAAASTLAILECYDAIEPIASKLSSGSPTEVTASFLAALGAMHELPSAVSSKFAPFLHDSAPAVRAGACLALGASKETSANRLAEKMEDANPDVRRAAALSLGKLKAWQFGDEICKLLNDLVPKVRIAAMKALSNLGEKGELYGSDICKRAVYDDDKGVRVAATRVLISMGMRGAAFAEDMTSLCEDPSSEVRKAGLDALAKMGEAAKPFLSTAQSLLDDPVEEVRGAAEAALAVLR